MQTFPVSIIILNYSCIIYQQYLNLFEQISIKIDSINYTLCKYDQSVHYVPSQRLLPVPVTLNYPGNDKFPILSRSHAWR